MYVHCVCLVPEEVNSLEPLELELQMSMTHPPRGCRESDLGPLGEQPVLAAAEPSLCPEIFT